MKTAVSISDSLFDRAEKYAKKTKLSRSRLYSEALEDYLDRREKSRILDQINRVCEKVDTSVDPVLFKMSLLSLPKDEC